MKTRHALAAIVSAVALLTTTGCAVMRDQESVGAYVDDATLTTRVKAKFAESPVVSMMTITVETMKGTVQLSGYAKTSDEKATAERLARQTSGVVTVRNDIIVRG